MIVRLGIQRVALFKSLPQRGIPHDDRVDDAVSVKRKLVLAQNAHLLRPRDGTTGGVDFTSQNLHKCGLAGAVGPGYCVAAPGHKGAGHILEEHPRAEAHSDVVDREHNPPIIARIRRSRSQGYARDVTDSKKEASIRRGRLQTSGTKGSVVLYLDSTNVSGYRPSRSSSYSPGWKSGGELNPSP